MSNNQEEFECMGTYINRNNTASEEPTNPDCQACDDVDRCYVISTLGSANVAEAAKKAKLLHYEKREPTEFIQVDGFYLPGKSDAIMVTDEDDDCIQAGKTIELMSGCADVRVLIRDPRAEPNKANLKRLLKKISDDIDTIIGNDFGDATFGGHETVLQKTMNEDEYQEYDCLIHGHDACMCGRAGTGKDGVK